MILKLIMLGIVLLAIYKFMGGNIPLPGQKKSNNTTESEALEECETCGTYVTAKDSIIQKGKLYCSKECVPS